MKVRMRHAPDVPELRKNPSTGLVHGVGDYFPAGNLLVRVEPGVRM